MTIHHSTIKKAERLGVILTETDSGVMAHYAKNNVRLFGPTPADAMNQITAAIEIIGMGLEMTVHEDNRHVTVKNPESGLILDGGPHTAFGAHGLLKTGKATWADPNAAPPADTKPEAEVARAANGVALDGAVAYREGTPAGDNPYAREDATEEEYALAAKWDEEWDAAADAAEEAKPKPTGSVVSDRYRALYAEKGHPTHCGDWLANLLNNMCQSKAGTDLDRFEAICQANGVDTSKYNRTTKGWQGRLRMTGRNLLAKRVYLNDGILLTPFEWAEQKQFKAPAEWMAEQKYKMPVAQQKAA